jgi:glycosyltransferase involved in cell wall biosynthesis
MKADARKGGATMSSERPLVSVLVICFNQQATIEAALSGVLAQTYTPLEIVVSDNASVDNSFAIVEAMAARYDGPHTLVLNRNATNLGMMGNIDHAMGLVSGEFVVANHGDDISVPHRVERLVAAWLASGKRAKAVHSARRRMDEAGALHEVMDDRRVLANMTPLEVIRDHGTLVGATLGWARELWDVFGPISPIGIFDDFPTAFRASLLGEIHYIPEPLLLYRQGGMSTGPTADFGHHYLYGHRIKNLDWHRSFWARYLADMEIVRPVDYETCRRLCEEKIAAADFHIALAKAGRPAVVRHVPRALSLAARQRSVEPLKEVVRYLLPQHYEKRLNRKMDGRLSEVRRAARRVGDGHGA